MYYSIENRSRFLIGIYLNFVIGYQRSIKLKMVRQNQSLRSMRGIVPCPILDNTRKVGFNGNSDLLDLDDPEIRDELIR